MTILEIERTISRYMNKAADGSKYAYFDWSRWTNIKQRDVMSKFGYRFTTLNGIPVITWN